MSGIEGAQVLLLESSEADLDRLICQLTLSKTMLMHCCLPGQIFTDYNGWQQVESRARYRTSSSSSSFSSSPTLPRTPP